MLFQAASTGVTLQYNADIEVFGPTMRLSGPMKWLRDYGSGFIARTSGKPDDGDADPTVAQVIQASLDGAGFTGTSNISKSSVVEIIEEKLITSSQTAFGKQRVYLDELFAMLSLIEGGLIWDGPRWEVSYTTSWDRENPVTVAHHICLLYTSPSPRD